MVERWAENPKVVGSILTLDIVVRLLFFVVVYCLIPESGNYSTIDFLNFNFYYLDYIITLFLPLDLGYYVIFYITAFIIFLGFQTKNNSRFFLLIKYKLLFNFFDLLFVYSYKVLFQIYLFLSFFLKYVFQFFFTIFYRFIHKFFVF